MQLLNLPNPITAIAFMLSVASMLQFLAGYASLVWSWDTGDDRWLDLFTISALSFPVVMWLGESLVRLTLLSLWWVIPIHLLSTLQLESRFRHAYFRYRRLNDKE